MVKVITYGSKGLKRDFKKKDTCLRAVGRFPGMEHLSKYK